MNKVIRKSYRKKIHGVKEKKIYVFTWAAMGIQLTHFSVSVFLPTAADSTSIKGERKTF